MFDLKLTGTGDIDCFMSTPLAKCRVTFGISLYGGQRIHFLTLPRQINTKKKTEQRVTFKYIADEPFLLKSSNLDNIEECIQAIRLQFMTELQDVTDNIIGTEFYKTRHTVIKDSTGLDRIKTMATEIVTTILPEATVEVGFEASTGYFYCQSICIAVFLGDTLITKFIF